MVCNLDFSENPPPPHPPCIYEPPPTPTPHPLLSSCLYKGRLLSLLQILAYHGSASCGGGGWGVGGGGMGRLNFYCANIGILQETVRRKNHAAIARAVVLRSAASAFFVTGAGAEKYRLILLIRSR
jgi:hypothetical protein